MGAGIAVEFKKRYGSIQVLLQQKKEVGQVAVLQKERLIFYIVTKEINQGIKKNKDVRYTRI